MNPLRHPLRIASGLKDPFRKQINRAPSPLVAYMLPWLSIMLGSAFITWPSIASAPILPPMGFLLLLGWRQLHPGLLPIWASLPLGLFDDMVSGQPAGSAGLLWSSAVLLLEMVEYRWPWRNFGIEWVLSTIMIVAYLLLGGWISHGNQSPIWLTAVVPQIILSILLYPLVARMVAALDRLRLVRFREIG